MGVSIVIEIARGYVDKRSFKNWLDFGPISVCSCTSGCKQELTRCQLLEGSSELEPREKIFVSLNTRTESTEILYLKRRFC